MRRRKRENNSIEGASGWMTTYGDMVTLLLTFFVLLFSLSTIDAQKWQDLVGSFRGNAGAGIFDGRGSFVEMPGLNDHTSESAKTDKNAERFIDLYTSIEQYMDTNQIAAEIELSENQTEILIRFKDYILFDTGKSDIREEAREILDEVSNILVLYQDQIDRIRVEGHADNRPINTKLYPTNWELSVDRATKVVRYFQEQRNIPGNKLSAAGYGEYYPIDSNDTSKGMARNRRVDILIVKTIDAINTEDILKE